MFGRFEYDPGRKSVIPHRVLHLSSAHPWTDNRIHWREAISLGAEGYDVGLYAVATEDDVRTPIRVSRSVRLSRFQRMSIGTLRALRVALSSGAEIIHIHDPELIWTIPVLRSTGRKVIYDAHEDLPSQVMNKPYLPHALRKPVSWAAKGVVSFAGISSSWVIAATETIAQRFDRQKTTVVRNFPHAPAEVEEKLEVEDRSTYAVYVGGVSKSRGGHVMVDAFASSSLPAGWQLLMAGPSSESYIKELGQRPGWKNVKYYGQVPPTEAREKIAQSRVGIVALKGTEAYRDSLPTKMFEYMADGAAVIASDFPLWRSIIERFDCGVLIDENSSEAIAEAIASYAADEELLRRHSRNGIKAAKEWLNWENEAKSLLTAYENVLES